jgi:DNA-binding protein
MENAGYAVGDIVIGSETVQAEDGRTRNVSTIEIQIKRNS